MRSSAAIPAQAWKQRLEKLTGIDVDLCDSCRAQAIAEVANKLVTRETSCGAFESATTAAFPIVEATLASGQVQRGFSRMSPKSFAIRGILERERTYKLC